jgi:5-methyltetrahydrofolate--homocysteine methyltransferase
LALQVVAGFKEAGDDYSYIMAEALADRLAEAYAEKLHEMVRRELWGYAPDEALSVDDMLKVKYQVSHSKRAVANSGCWGS